MIIDGNKIAKETLDEIKLDLGDKKLKLAAILVGNDPGLKKFVDLKKDAAESIGIDFNSYELSYDISYDNLKTAISKIVNDNNDGVLIELPLPKHIDAQSILNIIPEEKDVDLLSQKAQDNFYANCDDFVNRHIMPPAVEALKILLEKYNIELKGMKIAVFGQGLLVGKPISHWLVKQGASVSRIDEFTASPENFSKEADIIISGVGKPDLITGDMVKNDVIVVDFGYGNKDGSMVGDVNFASVSPKSKFITPVPGGVGPLLIAAVLRNLAKLN
jgi:methylenetetrahydrofolate dehydrogenase (NADP+) / methenyltetrahydrofolate cyclohydrolase